MFWQSIGCLFTEDFCMTMVFFWHCGFHFRGCSRSDSYSTDIVLVVVDGSWDVLHSGKETSFLCIVRLEDDG